MADELHTPNHRWYEPRNHIPLAKEDVSKQWIFDSGIQKIDAFIAEQPWGGGGAFSPASLFASGEEGAWYEPSTTTAFKSTTDLTPCEFATGVVSDQQCGFLLDKSKGAGYADGSFTGLGSELVTSGTFDDASALDDWSFQTNATGSVVSSELQVTLSSSTQRSAYQDIVTEVGKQYYVSSTLRSASGSLYLSASLTNFTAIASVTEAATGSNQQLSLVFTATTTTTRIVVAQVALGSAETYFADNISVRELPGNHATQVTAGARPILARVPPRGRVNELSETDTLATQSVTVTAAQRTLSFKGTGTVTLSGASTAGPLVGTGAEDRVSLTFTPSSGTLTLTVLGAVTDAQLELGSAVTNYQFVADLLGYDITEAGVTSLDYLSFDGSDDGMVVPELKASAGPVNIFTAFETNTDGTYKYIIDIQTGRIIVGARVESGNSGIAFGGWKQVATSLNTPYVLTGIFETAGSLRLDGVEQTTFSGTELAMSGGIAIGKNGASATNHFDGNLYGLIVRGASSTADEISNTEAYLANRSGVTLP